MRFDRIRTAIVALFFVGCATSIATAQEQPSPEEIQAMIENARRYTQPGENHEVLERFLGK